MANMQKVIESKVEQIRREAGGEKAVVALSGGVDSSVVAVLGHRALGDKLTCLFVENGIMREGEAAEVKEIFAKLGIKVQVLNAKKEFFAALAGKTDPEIKRQAITDNWASTWKKNTAIR